MTGASRRVSAMLARAPPMCNTTAGSAFIVHDRMNGTAYWPKLAPGFADSVEHEMSRADGMMNQFKSSRIGYAYGSNPGPTTNMRPLVPNVADRSWALLSAGAWSTDDLGEISTAMRGVAKPFDYGNYCQSPVLHYGALIDSAREAGAEDLARAA